MNLLTLTPATRYILASNYRGLNLGASRRRQKSSNDVFKLRWEPRGDVGSLIKVTVAGRRWRYKVPRGGRYPSSHTSKISLRRETEKLFYGTRQIIQSHTK